MAQAGQEVLLMDGDLRRPQVAHMLGVENVVGVTTVLLGKIDVDDVIQNHYASGLNVLASGAVPPNPWELLQSNAMAELLPRSARPTTRSSSTPRRSCRSPTPRCSRSKPTAPSWSPGTARPPGSSSPAPPSGSTPWTPASSASCSTGSRPRDAVMATAMATATGMATGTLPSSGPEEEARQVLEGARTPAGNSRNCPGAGVQAPGGHPRGDRGSRLRPPSRRGGPLSR